MKSFSRFWRNNLLCRNIRYLIWKPSLFSLGWNKQKHFFWKPPKISISSSPKPQCQRLAICYISVSIQPYNWKPLFFSPIFQPPRKRLRKQQSPLVKEVTDDSFYTKEELAVSKLENHHLFFDDDVPCEANTPLEEDRECCPKCDRKFITYFR